MLLALLAALLLLSPTAGSARLPSATDNAAPLHIRLQQAAAVSWSRYAPTRSESHEANGPAAVKIWRLWLQALRAAAHTFHTFLLAGTDAGSQRGTSRPAAAPRVMRRYFVNGKDPLAVCNDGSPGTHALGCARGLPSLGCA